MPSPSINVGRAPRPAPGLARLPEFPERPQAGQGAGCGPGGPPHIFLCTLALLLTIPLPAQKKAPFAIVNLALLEAEDGFAARSDNVFSPGETLYVAFHVQGYAVDRQSRVHLTYRIDALDPAAVPFVEPEISKIDTELAPQDAKWMPRVRFSPALPPFVDSGKYKFRIQVTDELAKSQVSQELIFQVKGRDVDASTELVARNFGFSRQEDGDALPIPAFRRGDVLWSSFDITGYKTSDKNRLAVDYGIAVYNGENKLIYKQPEPAREEGTSFYRRRYVHAIFSLNLEKGLQPGEYSVVLSVRDLIGNQTHESREKFTVE